ncbi:hypothetical protein [Streptomyces sp. TE5632]
MDLPAEGAGLQERPGFVDLPSDIRGEADVVVPPPALQQEVAGPRVRVELVLAVHGNQGGEELEPVEAA